MKFLEIECHSVLRSFVDERFPIRQRHMKRSLKEVCGFPKNYGNVIGFNEFSGYIEFQDCVRALSVWLYCGHEYIHMIKFDKNKEYNDRDKHGSVIKKEIAPVSFINMEMDGRIRLCTEKSRMNILKEN